MLSLSCVCCVLVISSIRGCNFARLLAAAFPIIHFHLSHSFPRLFPSSCASIIYFAIWFLHVSCIRFPANYRPSLFRLHSFAHSAKLFPSNPPLNSGRKERGNQVTRRVNGSDEWWIQLVRELIRETGEQSETGERRKVPR